MGTAGRVPDEENAHGGSRETASTPELAGPPGALTLASQIGNRALAQLVARRQALGGQQRVARWGWEDAESVLDAAIAVANPAYAPIALGKGLVDAYQGATAPKPQGLVQPPAPIPTPTPAPTPTPKGDTEPTPPVPKPTPSHGGWVEGTWSDPDFKGEQKASESEVTKQQIYAELGKVAPHLPHALKVCLVGHSWQEQRGRGVLNFNFFGQEGKSGAFVLGLTSTYVATSTYEKDPDKTKYLDWDYKNHKPNFGPHPDDRGPAGTIDAQLSRVPKPKRLVVVMRKPRPAFQSLSHAAASFVHLIETRVEALRASTDAGHNDLGARAYAGDANAYAYIVNHRFKVTDKNGRKRDFGAYNDNPAYAGAVKTQIALADKELSK